MVSILRSQLPNVDSPWFQWSDDDFSVRNISSFRTTQGSPGQARVFGAVSKPTNDVRSFVIVAASGELLGQIQFTLGFEQLSPDDYLVGEIRLSSHSLLQLRRDVRNDDLDGHDGERDEILEHHHKCQSGNCEHDEKLLLNPCKFAVYYPYLAARMCQYTSVCLYSLSCPGGYR